jgi:hypothetical protein
MRCLSTGAHYLEVVASEVAQQTLGQLGAGGVVGAQEQHLFFFSML